PLAAAPEPRRRRGLGCERDLRASLARPVPVPRGAASWEGAGVGDAGGGVTAALGSAVEASLWPLRLENELLQPEAEAAGGRGAAGLGRAGQGAGCAPCAAGEQAGSFRAGKEFLASFGARASGASVVAIDNKIEQAMDLVKNHLMYAVREEVEILKEQIRELVEKNSQLERENTLLKTLASPEQLEKFQSRLSPEEPILETPHAPEAPGGSAV
uniref:TSC22 domain family protein 3 n=1 Tax=Suricata suricatta TaxID=37032 RepID=A0A673UST6_SURSU